MLFPSLGLSAPLVRAVDHFDAPTPVQTAAIPEILDGKDVLVTAQTGSGKTTAFVLPLLQRWLMEPRNALILVPTRELAAQIREVVQECAMHLPERPKVVSAVGGVSINPQIKALRGGADVIVATPGRLLDLVDQKAINLSHLKSLVLDEADRMLDLGFADELSKILNLLPASRQNMLFSATFPKGVESLAMEFLNEPTRIDIEAGPEEKPAIEERAIRVDTEQRSPLLRHLIRTEGWERVLVFVESKYNARHLADKMVRNGISALAFHGNLGQTGRTEALAEFKESNAQVLVATDLAARGLDIVDLPVVVNYDLPRSPVDYTHRIGRTGRAGEKGIAISFITAESDAHFSLIEKRQEFKLDREMIEGFEPTTPAIKRPNSGTGGIKGRRKSKKDKLREAAARSNG